MATAHLAISLEDDIARYMHSKSVRASFHTSCVKLRSTDPRDLIYSQLTTTIRGSEFLVDYTEDKIALFLRVLLHFRFDFYHNLDEWRN